MRLEVRESAPPPGKSLCIAFLHESRDPSAGAPVSVRAELAKACLVSGFGGRDTEIAGALTERGGWVLVGLGPAGNPLGKLRRALRRALREALRQPGRGLLLAFGEGIGRTEMRALLREVAQGDYRFRRYKSDEATRKLPREARAVGLPPPSIPAAELSEAAREAQALSPVIAWARDLGNTPGNDLGPAELARETRSMARREGLRLRVLGRKEIEREKMTGLLAVNSGSVRPPVFLIGEYVPPRAKGTAVLVGKGITFDSGGISIKPAPSMGEMKYDMMGAATAFACLRAAKRLKLPVRVVALAPVTENLPSGSACRPGDILRMRNGKTVEVDNTDAEGRLVLADALSYAGKFRPDVLIDYATLTGAVLIALGHARARVAPPGVAGLPGQPEIRMGRHEELGRPNRGHGQRRGLPEGVRPARGSLGSPRHRRCGAPREGALGLRRRSDRVRRRPDHGIPEKALWTESRVESLEWKVRALLSGFCRLWTLDS